ncbi:MAG: FtsL-like putative cell division protein [Bacteroidia bacterium]
MNRIYTHTDEVEPKQNAEPSKISEAVKKVADFDFSIKKELVVKQVPFIAYCCMLLVVFIYITHKTESTLSKIERLKKETKNMRTYYINTLSDLMQDSRQSSIAEKLTDKGIKQLKTPPYKITYSGNN